MRSSHSIRSVVVISLCWLLSSPVNAQITPDSSLMRERSIVNRNALIKGLPSERISGGAKRGETLFHSFKEFNIGIGRGAYFSNPARVKNILSRVTGENPSNIQGKLGVLGSANLFLLNPKGILFGPEASLDLNGSFLATTATSIKLSNGLDFSAVNPQALPLLTISVPVGLNFASKPGSIDVQGVGHVLNSNPINNSVSVEGAGASLTGLRVQPGKSIILAGGNVNFNGGILTAPIGQITVGSVDAGEVTISPDARGWSLDYSKVNAFQNIKLDNLSLLDASGPGSADIRLHGNTISLTNGSFVLVQSQGFSQGGDIIVNASDSLSIIGSSSPVPGSSFSPVRVRSAIVSENLTGQGADISIFTKNLFHKAPGGITATSYLSGSSGNITVDASKSIKFVGISPIDPFINFNLIGTGSLGSSSTGNITVQTTDLLIQDGGSITTSTFGSKPGGDVTITALGSIRLEGVNPASFAPSTFSSLTFGPRKAGNLSVTTPQLTLLNGGVINANTISQGSAGSVTINASDFVKVSGTVPGSINPSRISSSATQIDPELQELFKDYIRIPFSPSGNSGGITINTGRLSVDRGAEITVRTDGSGSGGNLQIDAASINLDNQSKVTASTLGGQGGNIDLLNTDLLLMRRNSEISATASGTGAGGNVTINSDLVTALEDSDLTAKAFEGQGGDITINTQGLFRSPDSDIDASSALGIEGTIEINAPETDFARASETPVIAPESPQISSACQSGRGSEASSFTNIGAGGIPSSPSDPLTSNVLWEDKSAPEVSSNSLVPNQPVIPPPAVTYVEAQGWKSNGDGTVDFVTDATETLDQTALAPNSCK